MGIVTRHWFRVFCLVLCAAGAQGARFWVDRAEVPPVRGACKNHDCYDYSVVLLYLAAEPVDESIEYRQK